MEKYVEPKMEVVRFDEGQDSFLTASGNSGRVCNFDVCWDWGRWGECIIDRILFGD